MTVVADYTQVSVIILELEAALRAVDLWEQTTPCAEALASPEPFCVDTLSFSQWLQFVFIARIQFMVEHRTPLPQKSDIASMAETYFGSGQAQAQPVIRILKKFDQLIAAQWNEQ